MGGCVSEWLRTGKARWCEPAFVPNTRLDFALENAKLLLFVVRVCIAASRVEGMNKPFMCVCITQSFLIHQNTELSVAQGVGLCLYTLLPTPVIRVA